MMKISCDLCGKDISDGILARQMVKFNFSLIRFGQEMDICSDCRNAFEEWWKQRKALREVGESE